MEYLSLGILISSDDPPSNLVCQQQKNSYGLKYKQKSNIIIIFNLIIPNLPFN